MKAQVVDRLPPSGGFFMPRDGRYDAVPWMAMSGVIQISEAQLTQMAKK